MRVKLLSKEIPVLYSLRYSQQNTTNGNSDVEGARVMLRPDGSSGLLTEPLQRQSFLLPLEVRHG